MQTRLRSEPNIDVKLNGLARLTRWREHVPSTIPLTIVGAMLATNASGELIDLRLAIVIIANVLTVTFAFMINDVADAADDVRDPKKRAHNVISSRILTYREGMGAAIATAMVAFMLYAISGWWVMIWGSITLALSYLYSAYPFRLKARPITDITSHSLMLGGLLVLNGYFIYHDSPGIAWLVIIGAILFSAYGQFYNQIEDYEVDKKAGLRNTVMLLGKGPTMILMYASIVGASAGLGAAVWKDVFPAWLGVVFVIGTIVCALFPWEVDMRGNPTTGPGAAQRPSLLIANFVTILWMVQSLGWLSP